MKDTAQNRMRSLAADDADRPIAFMPGKEAAAHFSATLQDLAVSGAKRFCDIGGGATPTLSLKKIQRFGLEYVVLDGSQDRLDRAPAAYDTFRADILDRQAITELVSRRGPFDVVVSRFTAEHIRDGKLFHEQAFNMLRPGGTAVHYFPTLYALPFVLNRVLSPNLSTALLYRAVPVRDTKWRPYYSWCRGPTRRQLRRLQALGFRIDRYIGFFGHDMYKRVNLAHRAHATLSRLLVEHPCPYLTSFAVVVMSRPAG